MTTTTCLHPAIGQLCRDGQTIYYAYIAADLASSYQVYYEDTVEELTFLLAQEERCGLRPPSSAVAER